MNKQEKKMICIEWFNSKKRGELIKLLNREGQSNKERGNNNKG